MSERTSRSKLLGLVIRFLDDAIEARDRVANDRREILGEDAVGTWLQSQVAPVHEQDPGAAVSRLGPLQFAHDPFELVLLRQRDRHVETQPDDVAIEIRRRQQRPQLVHVVAPHVEPSPGPDWLRFDPRTHPVPEQRHQCDRPGTRLVEVRRLGSTGVYRRHRRAFGDVAERMRIADGEVVQSTQDAGIAANREIGLLPVHIERAAVYASNSDALILCFARG